LIGQNEHLLVVSLTGHYDGLANGFRPLFAPSASEQFSARYESIEAGRKMRDVPLLNGHESGNLLPPPLPTAAAATGAAEGKFCQIIGVLVGIERKATDQVEACERKRDRCKQRPEGR